ncbi:hypothetical protein ACSBR2_023336 [Camellia fascicularis]
MLLHWLSIDRTPPTLFYFARVREMTMNPLNFNMIMGVIMREPSLMRYEHLIGHFQHSQPATDEVTCYARGFILYVLGTTLFANRENTISLHLLGALRDLEWVSEYHWGGTKLATLYMYISSISRGEGELLGGY